MKLQPVYLLAPEPKPKSMTSRRAFLLAGCTFAAGTLIGGACGYSLGVGRGGGDPEDPEAAKPADDAELESSGDADLDELRRLAVKAPIEELIQKVIMFVSLHSQRYGKDPVLWRGISRLATHLLESESTYPQSIYGLVAQQIEGNSPPASLKLEPLARQLRRKREEVRRKR